MIVPPAPRGQKKPGLNKVRAVRTVNLMQSTSVQFLNRLDAFKHQPTHGKFSKHIKCNKRQITTKLNPYLCYHQHLTKILPNVLGLKSVRSYFVLVH